MTLDESYIDGGDMTEAFCRTITGNKFSDNDVLLNASTFTNFSRFKQLITEIVLFDVGNVEIETKDKERMLFAVLTFAKGRSFFTTKEGYIGVSPQTAMAGDQVCVILGCQSPLLLRSDGSGNHEVIGECYTHGIMSGEALLGPLPEYWQVAMIARHPGRRYNIIGFINRMTGETTIEDPRLGPLPPGWRTTEHTLMDTFHQYVNDETGEGFDGDKKPLDPRLTAQALTERGVKLQKFNLV